MKPRNKREVKLQRYSRELRTPDVRQWAIKTFSKYFLFTRYTSNVCSKCNYKWKEEAKKGHIVCPNCKVKLINDKRFHKYGTLSYADHFAVLETYKGYQVVRIFYIETILMATRIPYYIISEIVQTWINEEGNKFSLSKYPLSTCQGTYALSSPLEFRASSHYISIKVSKIYPKIKVLPIIRRNGFRTSFYGVHPIRFIRSILIDPKAETLLKTKQRALFKYYMFNNSGVSTYWKSVKVAYKNNYVPDSYNDWFDYLSLLEEFRKDFNNPKYACPADLHKEHQRYVKRRVDIIKKERKANLIKMIKQNQKQYLKDKKKYLKKKIVKNDISIEVLQSIKQFFDLGENMNHCLFTNAYYKKKNSLILLAKKGDKELETIEVSIPNRFVIQSRGLDNLPTKDHQAIVKMVNDNINSLIK